MSIPDRQVFLSVVRSDSDVPDDDAPPDVAVIELDRPSLLDLIVGIVGAPQSSDDSDRPITTMGVAWTTVPTDYRGLAYEALRIVYDAAAQWQPTVWMDEDVLAVFGALHTTPSGCHKLGTDFVWETDHPEFGLLRTDPVSLTEVLKGMLYVGEPSDVRALCGPMTQLCPEVLATALLAGVGPRFGVAGSDITKRSIDDRVGPDELRPMLFHESERVREAAQEVLGLEAPPRG